MTWEEYDLWASTELTEILSKMFKGNEQHFVSFYALQPKKVFDKVVSIMNPIVPNFIEI